MHPPVEPFAQNLNRYFETLKLSDLERLNLFYTENAVFKDPFNEVKGIDEQSQPRSWR